MEREIIEPKGSQNTHDEVEKRDDLALQLVARAVDVAVVLGEATNSEEAVKSARSLIAVDRAEFEESQG